MTSDASASTKVGDLGSDWNVRDATLLRAKGSLDRTTRFERNHSPAMLAAALDRAARTVKETPPNRDGYAVPLHETGTPVTTDEYVLWRPDSEQIGWYDTSFGIDGTERFVSLAEAAETTIGDRLKYWHPDLTPETEARLDDFELPRSEVRPKSRLSTDECQAFFEDMYEFVQSERDAEQRANWRRHLETGIETLVAKGIAAGPFVSLGRVSRPNDVGRFQFQIAEDDHREPGGSTDLYQDEEIYPDSIFLIDTLEESEHFPLTVRTTAVDGAVVTVKPDRRCSASPSLAEQLLTSDREFWLTHLLNPVPFERRTKALDAIRSNQSKHDLITGTRPVRFGADRLSVPSVELDLNEYQQQALKWADDAEDLLCIHGPPGTGKTRTLTAYVLHAVWHGQSVLVTAHSNQAVDNLLVGDSTLDNPEPSTLHEVARRNEDESLTIARVGHNSKNEVVQRHYEDTSVAAADIVAATTSGAAQFDTDQFDVGVVDEATQASRPATAIVLNCAQKLILSGDHKQLPPYSANESMHTDQTHTSLFEYLLERYGEDVSVLLGRQYRMHADIAEFPNKTFYDGNLETAERNQDWRIGDLDPLVGIDVNGEECRESGGDSFYNPAEAEAVADEVETLVTNGVAPENIGIISMYRGQVERIRSRLDQTAVEDAGRVTVDTVDSFQGGEREAIVVSFVRSNDDGNAGFLELPEEGPRRLNVALTRARKRLVLIGDWETLSTVASHRTPENSCAHLYDELSRRLEQDGQMVTT